MTTPTNWPDPAREGVPLFPERSGRHYVGGHLLFWYSDIQKWVTSNPIRACKEPEDFAGYEYHGPVLTHAQIAEMLAAERERICLMIARSLDASCSLLPPAGRTLLKAAAEDITDAIRNLGDAL